MKVNGAFLCHENTIIYITVRHRLNRTNLYPDMLNKIPQVKENNERAYLQRR